jgi:CheY-like chemotaxis protein
VLDLNETVSGMLKMLQRLIGEEITLQWRPGADLWRVNVDPSQIDQILANLCVNARDAIGGVGTITIATSNGGAPAATGVDDPDEGVGDFVRLEIADDGCGMDPDTLRHVFEPFFTTKAVGVGTGLGLATVYGAVKQNGGFVTVDSSPGSGATFAVFLPRYAGDVQSPVDGREAGPTAPGSETILLVEDERSILKMTAAILRKRGYTVIEAMTPGEAIRLTLDYPGRIDLLMTDVVMPEMNGRTLAKHVLAINPRIKRLFMSGYSPDVVAHHGVVDEGVNFLRKPFSVADLAAAVRRALESA